jgi:hypothetical protein
MKTEGESRYVARRCEYLARCRGDLITAADIRREFELPEMDEEKHRQTQEAGIGCGRHRYLSPEVERLIRVNEVNGSKPRKEFVCEACVWGSGQHRADCEMVRSGPAGLQQEFGGLAYEHKSSG